MKKLAMLFAVAAIAVSASAQKTVLTGSKWTDNTYVGVAFGAETRVIDKAFDAYNPNATIMVGKNFTPVFGLRVEAGFHASVHGNECEYGYVYGGKRNTFLNSMNFDLVSTWNLMNLFGGYKGEPRTFEISALYGLGWGHMFDHADYANAMTSKAGLDFAINLGKEKQFQIFVEPALNYVLTSHNMYDNTEFQYDIHRADLELKAGLIYKFKCSNGKHNFAYEQLRDQSEIDGLNAKINGLRSDLDAANAAAAAAAAQVASLKKQLADCQNKPVQKVETKVANLQPSVVFLVNSSVVRASQMANVEMIANYMKNNPNAKVKIAGYASTEGPAELNKKLSVARANAVKDVLVKKYKIAANRLEAEGYGATDKLFSEREFNRVALFNDTTK